MTDYNNIHMYTYLTLFASPTLLWCLCLCFRCFLCLCFRCSLQDLCFLCFFLPSWASNSFLFFFIFFMCFFLRYSVPLVLLVSTFVSVSASAHSLAFINSMLETYEHVAKLLLLAATFRDVDGTLWLFDVIIWLLTERLSSEVDVCRRRLPNESRGFGSYTVDENKNRR